MSQIAELSKKLVELKDQCQDLEKQKTEKEREKMKVQAELISAMNDEGVAAFKNAELGIKFNIQSDITVKKIDEQAVFVWLKESGNGDAIKETIHPSTFKSIAAGYVEETGLNIPGTEITSFQRIWTKR